MKNEIVSAINLQALLATFLAVIPGFFLLDNLFFFFNDQANTEIYNLSLHDALPIFSRFPAGLTSEMRTRLLAVYGQTEPDRAPRAEEHTSELQSAYDLVCRVLL